MNEYRTITVRTKQSNQPTHRHSLETINQPTNQPTKPTPAGINRIDNQNNNKRTSVGIIFAGRQQIKSNQINEFGINIGRERVKERERERVCVCVCERERERERNRNRALFIIIVIIIRRAVRRRL